MQGLADGYFILPQTLNISSAARPPLGTEHGAAAGAEARAAVEARLARLVAVGGRTSVETFHRRLGELMWEHCGMSRSRTGLQQALAEIPALREEFWSGICVCGGSAEFNVVLEKAGRSPTTWNCRGHGRDALKARGIRAWRAFPHRAPDRRRRAEGRRRRIRTCRRLGFRGDGVAPQRAVEPLPLRAPATGREGLSNGVHLHIWRQHGAAEVGAFVTYPVRGISPDLSFLEMLDVLNEELVGRGEAPIAFDHDCREGICGSCAMVINRGPHGPLPGTTARQLYMRHFDNASDITVEPWRAGVSALRDLIVDRSALDNVIQAGGYVSVNTGAAPDAHAVPVAKQAADAAFEAAACIGCGAAVAACPERCRDAVHCGEGRAARDHAAGPTGRARRVIGMVEAMDDAGFGNCTNHYACAGGLSEADPAALHCPAQPRFLSAAGAVASSWNWRARTRTRNDPDPDRLGGRLSRDAGLCSNCRPRSQTGTTMPDRPDIDAVKTYLLELQERICAALAAEDGQPPWRTAGTGPAAVAAVRGCSKAARYPKRPVSISSHFWRRTASLGDRSTT